MKDEAARAEYAKHKAKLEIKYEAMLNAVLEMAAEAKPYRKAALAAAEKTKATWEAAETEYKAELEAAEKTTTEAIKTVLKAELDAALMKLDAMLIGSATWETTRAELDASRVKYEAAEAEYEAAEAELKRAQKAIGTALGAAEREEAYAAWEAALETRSMASDTAYTAEVEAEARLKAVWELAEAEVPAETDIAAYAALAKMKTAFEAWTAYKETREAAVDAKIKLKATQIQVEKAKTRLKAVQEVEIGELGSEEKAQLKAALKGRAEAKARLKAVQGVAFEVWKATWIEYKTALKAGSEAKERLKAVLKSGAEVKTWLKAKAETAETECEVAEAEYKKAWTSSEMKALRTAFEARNAAWIKYKAALKARAEAKARFKTAWNVGAEVKTRLESALKGGAKAGLKAASATSDKALAEYKAARSGLNIKRIELCKASTAHLKASITMIKALGMEVMLPKNEAWNVALFAAYEAEMEAMMAKNGQHWTGEEWGALELTLEAYEAEMKEMEAEMGGNGVLNVALSVALEALESLNEEAWKASIKTWNAQWNTASKAERTAILELLGAEAKALLKKRGIDIKNNLSE